MRYTTWLSEADRRKLREEVLDEILLLVKYSCTKRWLKYVRFLFVLLIICSICEF